MKYLLSLVLFSICFQVDACETFPVFSNLRMKESYVSIGTTLTFYNDGKEIATIDEKIIALSKKMTFKSKGKLVATATKKIISIGSKTEITDCDGKLIGSIEEQIIKSMTSIKSQYSIFDSNHKLVATSTMHDLFQAIVEVKADNNTFTAKRDYLNIFRDGWSIKQSGNLDQRLVLFIPALKTLSDNLKKKADSKKDKPQ